ncbi:MAG: hypothetical protein Rhob2KO_26620 [Rhodopirellula baltica]
MEATAASSPSSGKNVPSKSVAKTFGGKDVMETIREDVGLDAIVEFIV